MSQVVRVSLSYVYTVSSFKYVYFPKLQRTVSSKEKLPLFANVHLRTSLSTKYRTTNVLVTPKSKKTELVRSFQVSLSSLQVSLLTQLTWHGVPPSVHRRLKSCLSKWLFSTYPPRRAVRNQGGVRWGFRWGILMGSFAKVPTSCIVFVILMRIFLAKLADKTVAVILSQ